MSDRLDPATLEAYVDGELEPEAMGETAERLMQDPEALARVRALHGDASAKPRNRSHLRRLEYR